MEVLGHEALFLCIGEAKKRASAAASVGLKYAHLVTRLGPGFFLPVCFTMTLLIHQSLFQQLGFCSHFWLRSFPFCKGKDSICQLLLPEKHKTTEAQKCYTKIIYNLLH